MMRDHMKKSVRRTEILKVQLILNLEIIVISFLRDLDALPDRNDMKNHDANSDIFRPQDVAIGSAMPQTPTCAPWIK